MPLEIEMEACPSFFLGGPSDDSIASCAIVKVPSAVMGLETKRLPSPAYCQV